jgi:hypothetical protein
MKSRTLKNNRLSYSRYGVKIKTTNNWNSSLRRGKRSALKEVTMGKIIVLEGSESIGNLKKELGRVNTARIHHKEELEELDKIAGTLQRKINKAVNAHTIRVQHRHFK